jgi:hypothetical protein
MIVLHSVMMETATPLFATLPGLLVLPRRMSVVRKTPATLVPSAGVGNARWMPVSVWTSCVSMRRRRRWQRQRGTQEDFRRQRSFIH